MCTKYLTILLLVCLTLLSCQKIDLGQDEEVTEEIEAQDGKVKVHFQIASIEQIPFENTISKSKKNTTSRATSKATGSASISSLCSRFTVAVFQGDTKVKAVSQSVDSNPSDFGQLTMSLSTGTYQLIAIAHNGQGNCTVSSPEKITFYNNKMTDTFYYYCTLTISEESTQSLTLKRPVSMFRLIIKDTIPQNVAQMKFYYTGGSSTFNALTGYGCVESRQTEIFSISTSSNGFDIASTNGSDNASTNGSDNASSSRTGCASSSDNSGFSVVTTPITTPTTTFEIYTFPHEVNDYLNIKITALDTQGATVAEKTLSSIYIQPNVITQHTCQFFNDSIQSTTTFTLEDNGNWSDLLNQ